MPLGTVLFFFATKYLSESYGIFGLTLASSSVSFVMTIAMTFILAFILPGFSALLIIRRIVLYLVLAAIGGFAGVQISAFSGLAGLPRLIVTFTVLLIPYVGVMWIIRETIFVRIIRSVRTATAPSNRQSKAP